MHPLVGRDLARLRQLDHVHRWRIASPFGELESDKDMLSEPPAWGWGCRLEAAHSVLPRKSGIPSSPVIAAFAADQERRGLDAEGSVNDGREAVVPVMAIAREAADAEPSRRTTSR
jgi:hypothetical protein